MPGKIKDLKLMKLHISLDKDSESSWTEAWAAIPDTQEVD